MSIADLAAIVLAIGTGIAAGLVGSFAVMRRMTLAVGSLLTTGEDLIEALFGGTGRLTAVETTARLVVVVGVVAFIVRARHRPVLAIVSPRSDSNGRHSASKGGPEECGGVPPRAGSSAGARSGHIARAAASLNGDGSPASWK